MPRAFIIMLDSFGVGATKDALKFGDQGADTFRHIAEYCEANKANKKNVRHGPLHVPNVVRLGINHAAKISQGKFVPGLAPDHLPEALYGCAAELSVGKDTQSGHWELAGVPVLFQWGYFPSTNNCFPKQLIDDLVRLGNIPGVLGSKYASGTLIIEELGERHQETNQPIIYTSADSVFQIAAHEETFGLERLYALCEAARKLVDDYHIGRVIARPFLGSKGHYYRTGNRRDYAVPPPEPTLLDKIVEAGGDVIGIGKISDIYAHQGISLSIKADGNKALFDAFIEASKKASDHSLTFVNLVDFDMLYGHRRDVIGYAKALEDFDTWLPAFEAILKPGDLVIITADHGCDPTFSGFDHTRENVPVIAFGPNIQPGPIGLRDTFADIGQSIAKHLGLAPLKYGKTFV